MTKKITRIRIPISAACHRAAMRTINSISVIPEKCSRQHTDGDLIQQHCRWGAILQENVTHNKKSELMIMGRATASVLPPRRSVYSLQRETIARFEGGTQIW